MGGQGLPRIARVEHFGRRGMEVRLHLTEGEPLEVALEAFEHSGLGSGDPLPADRRRALLDADADVRVRESALGILSYRARTRAELGRKLRTKGFDAERVDRCLDRLTERGPDDRARTG